MIKKICPWCNEEYRYCKPYAKCDTYRLVDKRDQYEIHYLYYCFSHEYSTRELKDVGMVVILPSCRDCVIVPGTLSENCYINNFVDAKYRLELPITGFEAIDMGLLEFVERCLTYLELVNLATIKYKVTRSYINYSVLEIETLLDSDDIYHKMPQDAFDENMYDDDTINNLYDLFPDLKTLRLFK